MQYQIHIEKVEPQPTAVVRRRARFSELAQVIPQACGEVWAFFRSSLLPHPGRNLALYRDDEINIECGVEVAQPFAGDDRVYCSTTPAGTVATTAHMGPYDRLSEAHTAILAWCADHGHALAGPCWELYGHWNDDPSQLRTDVYYLLQAQREPDKYTI